MELPEVPPEAVPGERRNGPMWLCSGCNQTHRAWGISAAGKYNKNFGHYYGRPKSLPPVCKTVCARNFRKAADSVKLAAKDNNTTLLVELARHLADTKLWKPHEYKSVVLFGESRLYAQLGLPVPDGASVGSHSPAASAYSPAAPAAGSVGAPPPLSLATPTMPTHGIAVGAPYDAYAAATGVGGTSPVVAVAGGAGLPPRAPGALRISADAPAIPATAAARVPSPISITHYPAPAEGTLPLPAEDNFTDKDLNVLMGLDSGGEEMAPASAMLAAVPAAAGASLWASSVEHRPRKRRSDCVDLRQRGDWKRATLFGPEAYEEAALGVAEILSSPPLDHGMTGAGAGAGAGAPTVSGSSDLQMFIVGLDMEPLDDDFMDVIMGAAGVDAARSPAMSLGADKEERLQVLLVPLDKDGAPQQEDAISLTQAEALSLVAARSALGASGASAEAAATDPEPAAEAKTAAEASDGSLAVPPGWYELVFRFPDTSVVVDYATSAGVAIQTPEGRILGQLKLRDETGVTDDDTIFEPDLVDAVTRWRSHPERDETHAVRYGRLQLVEGDVVSVAAVACPWNHLSKVDMPDQPRASLGRLMAGVGGLMRSYKVECRAPSA